VAVHRTDSACAAVSNDNILHLFIRPLYCRFQPLRDNDFEGDQRYEWRKNRMSLKVLVGQELAFKWMSDGVQSFVTSFSPELAASQLSATL